MKNCIILISVVAILLGCNNKNAIETGGRNERCCPPAKSAAAEKPTVIPPQSIFMLADTFQTQNKTNFVLSSLAGKTTIIAMIFTNCTYACPKLTSNIKKIATELNANKKKINYVLVSFDTERDNPDQLQKFAKQMQLDKDWILLHGNEMSVRTLSVLLNVQFEKDAQGNFSHNNLISVLDRSGVLRFQKEGPEADNAETISIIRKLL